MEDIIAEFLAETNDALSALDNDIVLLEQDPENDELISRIFRVLHTIKGTCGFLGLSRLERVAHKGEDVLGLFRDKKLAVTADYVSLILESLDRIKDIVTGIETTGQEPEGDDSALIARLEAVYNGHDLSVTAAHEPPAIHETENSTEEEADMETPVADEETIIEAPLPATADAGEESASDSDKAVRAPQTLRVNVELLENLMTMISELVLTRNQLLQISRQNKENEFLAPLQRLNHVVSDLQEGVMKTRMQPIGNAWSKLPRIVRDVCKELDKKIDLEMNGQETELDRQILDMIKDPLTHMVRNSADHGIETPAERLEKGKPETGRIVLNSYHQGGHIIIEIGDDGRGLTLDKIKKKIVQNGLATEEQVAAMSVQQIQQYIFHAGLSTAEKITAVSGRGVGMDVVRSNIEKIGGSIEMRSEEGKGTTFTIKIPLTLAIVSALIVGVAGQRFAIPQLAVSELVLVGKNNSNQIETIDNASVLRLRGKLLPLVSLSKLLNIPVEHEPDAQYIVVTRAGATVFGLIVDHVFDLEEIVIKPLSRNLKTLSIFSGNTILGDGCVIMILDPAGILKTVDLAEAHESKAAAKDDAEKTAQPENLLLLFRAGDQTLKAAPVDLISRLEEIETADIEYADGLPVIQYLGALMPVHNIDCSQNNEERRPLIILRHEDRNVGLVADQILDIAKYYGTLNWDSGKTISESVIINDCVADVINAPLLTAKGVKTVEGARNHDLHI